MRKLIAAGALAVGVGVGGTAFAGEDNGSGRGGVDGEGRTGAYYNSNSECAFSGLEDFDQGPSVAGRHPELGPDPQGSAGRDLQFGAHPGDSCRGNVAHE